MRFLPLSMILLSGSVLSPVTAQDSASPLRFSPQAQGYMERARTMLSAGNYAGVIDQLKHLDTDHTDLSLLNLLSPGEKEEYVYMLAQALYHRGDPECVTLLRAFASEYPASPLALKARLSIGDFYFFNHEWVEALREYDDCDFARLNASELNLYSYRRALTLINLEKYEAALPLLKKIGTTAEYKDASTFYTAYIDYAKGDLDKAYQSFSRVTPSVPGLESGYYMTQIEYRRGQYDEVISHGSALLKKNPQPELVPATQRVVGLSYFKQGNYQAAQGFLESYLRSAGDKADAEAVYALGVIEYAAGDTDSAAARFGSISDLESDLGQSAWLYLGQCHLKTGNPDAAAMAFEKAARMDFDRDVTETALYNYAAAVTRGGKIPFSSSVDLLERFIKNYPDSEYTPKVEEYLATAYYNERDYAKALRSIEGIRNPSAKVLAAKQKILFELGSECVTNGRYADGTTYLRQAIALESHSREIAALSRLWLGDALYAQQKYKEARQSYSAAASSLAQGHNRTLSLYDLAYATYMTGAYSEAAKEFARALSANPTLPAALKDDAEIRRADCLYYTGDYASAKTLYASAMSRSAADADYAAYRHAVMLGLGNDLKGKLAELTRFESAYPQSRWLSTAMLEKAMTLENLGRQADARKAFRDVSDKFPDATQARKALMNMATADFRAGKGAEAAEVYKEVMSRWPASEEADIAFEDLKKYYAAQGRLQEYAEFLNTVPGGRRLNDNEMEELAFEGAEIAYTDNISNISLLRNYVKTYPDGKYLAQALMDIATSLEAAKDYSGAEEALTILLARRPYSPQAPEALLMKAEILETKVPGRTPDANAAYLELERRGDREFIVEAVTGVMRTSSDLRQTLEYARKAKTLGGLPADQAEEASLYEAQALMGLRQDAAAVNLLSQLADNPTSLSGAKAAVTLAEYWLKTGNPAQAEAVSLKFTDAGTPHQYWLARGFIVLADAYHAQGKTYLAKEYIQSLKQNYPGKENDILTAISSRLKEWK